MQMIMNDIVVKRHRPSGLKWLRFMFLGAALLVCPGRMPVHAAEPLDPDDNPSANSDWTPPADGFDWIQLVSDEWLKGEIIAMYNDKMEFDSKQENDNVIDYNGFRVLLDPKSSIYLKGVTLDFQDGLKGKGFVFVNPNATNTCGCGESFSV